MTFVQQVRVVLAVVGVLVWGYGVYSDWSEVRIVGIVMLLLSLVLRFTRKRRDDEPAQEDGTAGGDS